MLVKKNLRDANALFSCVRSKEADDREFLQLPLIHFCDFLLQTVTVMMAGWTESQRKAAPVFNLLLEKYAPELDRDPSLDRVELGGDCDGSCCERSGQSTSISVHRASCFLIC